MGCSGSCSVKDGESIKQFHEMTEEEKEKLEKKLKNKIEI